MPMQVYYLAFSHSLEIYCAYSIFFFSNPHCLICLHPTMQYVLQPAQKNIWLQTHNKYTHKNMKRYVHAAHMFTHVHACTHARTHAHAHTHTHTHTHEHLDSTYIIIGSELATACNFSTFIKLINIQKNPCITQWP